MASEAQTVTLRKPIAQGETEYSEVMVNRPTALELLDFNLPDLVNGKASAVLKLVKKCGEFPDGKPLPHDFEAKIDLLDVIGFGGAVMYFLRGLDLIATTSDASNSEN